MVAALALIGVGRAALHHRIAAPSADLRAQAARVRIHRDSWGVPHVYGKTDADAAFGLAYAHAEDDFETIQLVLAAARGHLAWLRLSKTALLNDYLTGLLDVAGLVREQYPQLPAATRALLDGYARGLTLYAALHPGEADARLLPYRGEDIAAGFAHKMPLLLGVPQLIEQLRAREVHAGDVLGRAQPSSGSNAHAVSARRSSDGVTRLNVNSHQPWEGPVAWYEVQVVSEEGWNMTGGLFPGSPVVLHGHNDRLGWAHTVNTPALADVVDVAGEPLTARPGAVEVDLGLFTLRVPLTFHDSAAGPVFEAHGHPYALRYAGRERSVAAVDQWYAMNRAQSLAEWKAAMAKQRIPMFNTVYATAAGDVGYVYNALLPLRVHPEAAPGTVLRPAETWTAYRPYADLPQVENPPSGFVMSCNTPPFVATSGAGNPDPARFSRSDGIEREQNNRGLRSLALLGGAQPITPEAFEAMKWDRTYDVASPFWRGMQAVLAAPPQSPDEARALELLRGWNRVADEGSEGATIAILAGRELDAGKGGAEALKGATAWVWRHFGTVQVDLGRVQRLRRGKAVDLPLGGGPDVMNAAYVEDRGSRLVGTQGDSLILLVDFAPDGTRSRSVSPYGASNRKGAPHYADQAQMFVRHELKPTLRTLGVLRAHEERAYAPGE